MTVRVLADYHHSDLWESLTMLFVDRFGWELYRPIGMDWYDSGLWQFERAPAGRPGWVGDEVAHQYLDPRPDDAITFTGEWAERDDTDHPGRAYRMVTMEQARAMKPDLVISTLTENEAGWAGFASEIGAHFGIQVGNQGVANRWDLAEFAMLSVTTDFKPWKPHVYYHQEFSLDLFHYEYPPEERDYAGTWVQCLANAPSEAERFHRLAAKVPELRFRYHGHCGDKGDGMFGGNAPDTPGVADQMIRAGVGIHFKTWSDGYGHVIHNLFAVGKPVVATATYYRDKLAGPLFVDGVTSFDVQSHSEDEVVQFLRALALDDDLHYRMSAAAFHRFHEVVNFEDDADAVYDMLAGILG